MDNRAAKLANAWKKLRDHQEKKSVYTQRDEILDTMSSFGTSSDKNGVEQPFETQEKNVSYSENNHAKEIEATNEDMSINQNNHQNINHDVPVICDEKHYVNVTEILISNKTNLEMQNKELESKIVQLENQLSNEAYELNLNKQKLSALELQLNDAQSKYAVLIELNASQDSLINELRSQVKSLTDDKNNLIEQQEFTKSILTSKEREVAHLHSQVCTLRNQMDVMALKLQQLTNTSDSDLNLSLCPEDNDRNELLSEKVALLKHQLQTSLKDKDQINSHYEHYVNKLNEQLRVQAIKMESLTKQNTELYNRENDLVQQISNIEVQMQNYRRQCEIYAESQKGTQIEDLKNKVKSLQVDLSGLGKRYNDLRKQYEESVKTIEELNRTREEFSHDNISLTKLNADITSDKVAAQRATEQNKKLKTDTEELEQIVVKLGKDKLELTEKLSHEKQLNQQLILKLAEIDEISKQMQTKLKAKDEEMIRLQANYREIENKHEALLENLLQSKENAVSLANKCYKDVADASKDNSLGKEENDILTKTNDCSGDCITNVHRDVKKSDEILKEDAMYKLQERFLNIMDQVANLSDEKHRLEHIILQLQTETDTICEYITLYQQQRSLLKKRDEDRSAQIKLFQMECEEVRRQLEELSGLFLKLAKDKDLSAHLQVESRQNDITKIKTLLENLLNSNLINSKCMNLELNNFYPCSCCSGQLIDV